MHSPPARCSTSRAGGLFTDGKEPWCSHHKAGQGLYRSGSADDRDQKGGRLDRRTDHNANVAPSGIQTDADIFRKECVAFLVIEIETSDGHNRLGARQHENQTLGYCSVDVTAETAIAPSGPFLGSLGRLFAARSQKVSVEQD